MGKGLTPLLLLTLLASACTTTGIQRKHTGQTTQTKITHVTDGDTVDIKTGKGTDTVRLLGVDTPEVYGKNTPGEFEKIPDNQEGKNCLRKWGHRASNFAKKKLSNARINFTTDPRSDVRGAYGRLLGYIMKDGKNFNYQLVKKGLARVYDSDFTKKQKFLEAEQKAQNQLKGLWHCR
ncbi:MAG: thermonuclease family protein, partial [Candidatus Nanohalobium sp.]